MEISLPTYDELPQPINGYCCSWRYFNSLPNKNGKKDQLGTLNFLTAERKTAAAKEIQHGLSISLDCSIDHFIRDITAFGGRITPEHEVKETGPFSTDDLLKFNTQTSSQWDGFRHFGVRSTQQYYNGFTREEYLSQKALGTEAWVAKGSICGRGVLVDFYTWALALGKVVDVNSGRSITLDEIQATLDYQGTTIQPGDVLLFRTGWLNWYNHEDIDKRHDEMCVKNEPGKHAFIGLKAEEQFVRWLWNNQIAAVAADNVAFECTPPPPKGFGWLHEHLIACLGCPIGELFNLDTLATACKEHNRYSFYLVSAPLHVTGGVGSTPNAVAIL